MTLPETPGERAQREALEEAAGRSPLRGRPLPQRLRLARETVERYLAAARGPFAYMRRLRRIEDETERHERELRAAWTELAAADPEQFHEHWRATAQAWDFTAVNKLIEKHNAYYPVEARLPMDPRSGDYALLKGRSYRLEPLGADWILARFPADLREAQEPPAAS